MSNIMAVMLNGIAQLEYDRDKLLPDHQAAYLDKMDTKMDDGIVLDEETITNPDQAADFLQRLASGGEITIKFKRRRRTRQVKLNIQ